MRSRGDVREAGEHPGGAGRSRTSAGEFVERGIQGEQLQLAAGDVIAAGPPWSRLIPDVLEGRIVVIKAGLQRLGLLSVVRGRMTEALGAIAGRECAAAVEALGFEQLHTVLAEDDYPRLVSRAGDLFSRDIADTLGHLTPGVAPADAPVHFQRRIYLRVRPPGSNRDDRFLDHPGTLLDLAAHRDTWYGHPTNMVNLWAAVGRIGEANGVAFYPDAWGCAVPHRGIRISPQAELGRPLRCALDPGDILVFGSQHLHASVPNESAETRVAVSARFTLGLPRYDHRNGWIPYEDRLRLHSKHAWLRSYRSRMTRAFLHATPERFGPWLRRTIPGGRSRRV